MSALLPHNVPRRAIVTGGSTGIGVAIVQALLDDGYEVVNLSRRPAGLAHSRLRSIAVDLTDGGATRTIVSELAQTFPVTTVVHNAGVIRQKFLEDVVPEDVQALTQLHLATPISLVQANLAAMKTAGYGRIVLVSSRAVLGLAQRTVYSSTKAGMLGLARTWALELASQGITVNAVAPGPVATELFINSNPPDAPQTIRIRQSVPVERFGTPEEIAHAVAMFLDERAGFITGQLLYACGGMSVGLVG